MLYHTQPIFNRLSSEGKHFYHHAYNRKTDWNDWLNNGESIYADNMYSLYIKHDINYWLVGIRV